MKVLIFTCALISAGFAFASEIKGFQYTSCAQNACVLVTAPQAWLGMTQDVFSTGGQTELKITDRHGKTTSIYTGETATLNSRIQTITLEKKDGGFVLYSLKDGKISNFSGGAK